MTDLKLLTIRDILPVHKVEIAASIAPLTLDVTGEHLDETSEVRVNDVTVPEFMVLSAGRLLAQVPPSLAGSPLTKITVLADRPSTTRSSLLHFEAGTTIKTISGLERLIQSFCWLLLQTPGSDRFYPDEGGGLLKMVGTPVSRVTAPSMAAAVMHSVSRARDQMLSKQARNPRIPPDERLVNVEVTKTGYDPNTTTLAVTLTFSVLSGRQAVVNMML